VKERDRDAESVFVGKFHAFADVETVIYDVVMGEHDPFGETGSTGGVLHVDSFVTVKCSFDCVQFRVWHVLSEFDYTVKIYHSGGSFLSYEDDVLQEGEFGTGQLTGCGCGQFSDHAAQGFDVVGVFEGTYHEEGCGVGLLQDVFKFCRFVAGVDSYKYGTDLG
jgi:hypothetical protein